MFYAYHERKMKETAALFEQYGATTTVSWDFATTTVLPTVLVVFITISILFLLSSIWIHKYVIPTSPQQQQRKTAYQFTNLCVNSFIGVTGLYYYIYHLPELPTLEQKMVGLNHLYPISCLQIGYQLWALPVGIFWTKESTPMLGHHVAVIVVAARIAFYKVAFQYYTPLLFGMVELSSVPLAIMNIFQDHLHLREQFSTVFMLSQVAFVVTFLGIRWYLVLSPMVEFLQLMGYLIMSRPFRLFHLIVWISSHYLALLQLYWGCLVIKGTFRVLSSMTFKPKTIKKP